MSDSVRPHRWRPIRLPHPWVSPGKNTGVGCHFLLQCMKVKSESEVTQSCRTLSDPMDCSLPGSSVHGFSRQEYWSGVPLPSPLQMVSMLYIMNSNKVCMGFPCGSVIKNLPASAGNSGLIPGWGRFPGEGNGNPLPYSCLGNPMGRGAW